MIVISLNVYIYSVELKLLIHFYQGFEGDDSYSSYGSPLMLFLPPLLLCLVSTLNYEDKSSLKIIYRHPSLIILPIVTFFTFSRINVGCCSVNIWFFTRTTVKNNSVSFSKRYTYINIFFTTAMYALRVGMDTTNLNNDGFIVSMALHVLSILLTALFLHLDKVCCCCCDPREMLSVYDPVLDERFIMLDGKVVEDPEDDVGSETCCGWCGQKDEQESEHVVAFTVSNGNRQSTQVADGSEKVPLTAPEVETVETSIKEENTGGITAGEGIEGKAC